MVIIMVIMVIFAFIMVTLESFDRIEYMSRCTDDVLVRIKSLLIVFERIRTRTFSTVTLGMIFIT